ncbi:fumarylacetoacetate hydrolase family protein [Sphingomonas nostoxanthinifaciens]|uniref:fumarylacetoacetate hydrolase family protein n=1 Tax=Sphingomonas nostoxanthinifaciens TaxID=2872652 RepID=UPI001CC1D6C9|nr:fumarylacetoacetate hydrolase family protein [Sphingomonas nostoxanthinifaciens]UAK24771.1 fumarylacetoacetate hydrolase family protein [Sphingomonas nostoxanthinifaciens]
MKLVRHGPKGQEKPGIVDADGQVRDLSGHVADIDGALLANGLDAVRALDPASLPLVPAATRLAEPVAKVGKFICIGLNYSDHAAESGMPIPEEPIIFTKAISAIIGPNDTVLLPPTSTKSDWEVELGVVIGTEARYVTQEAALDHVAGYCVINDLSEREYQLERGGTWDKGKGCDTFGPFGPWLVTADEIADVGSLGLWLDVNGARMQTGNTSSLIFGIAHLVHYVSQFMSLQPGDIISTGTPPGVGLGMKPPVFLKEGDVITLGIDGLGEQRQEVRRYGA